MNSHNSSTFIFVWDLNSPGAPVRSFKASTVYPDSIFLYDLNNLA